MLIQGGTIATLGRSGREYNLPQYPNLGKFEGEARLTAMLWSMGLDGAECVGSGEGWSYTLIETPITPEELTYAAAELDMLPLSGEELSFSQDFAGAILAENSQGFVSGYYFVDSADLAEAWEECSVTDDDGEDY